MTDLIHQQIEAAAKVLAEGMDYSWEHMPEQGRANMRALAVKIVEATLAQPAPVQPQTIDAPEGYKLVMVPDEPAPDEPDWDECKRQAEVSTGLKVEQHTFSILKREVRRWIAHKATAAPVQQEAAAALKLPASVREALEFYANNNQRWITFGKERVERLKYHRESEDWQEIGEDGRGHEHFIVTERKAETALSDLDEWEDATAALQPTQGEGG